METFRTEDVPHGVWLLLHGYEVSGALGAALAEPDREVYALVGDGSYLMRTRS